MQSSATSYPGRLRSKFPEPTLQAVHSHKAAAADMTVDTGRIPVGPDTASAGVEAGVEAAEPDTAPAAAAVPEAGPAVANIAGFAAPRSFEPGLPEAGPAFEAAAVPA